jgi:hypothetical protein
LKQIQKLYIIHAVKAKEIPGLKKERYNPLYAISILIQI